MKRTLAGLAMALSLPLAALAAPEPAGTTVQLKDGGRIVVDKNGKTYHTDAAGKRVRMRDGVVMEGRDGRKYVMKNDALWKQITEKGTLAPNR